MHKHSTYFYAGILVSAVLALLVPVLAFFPHGTALKFILLMVFAQTHFVIAALYYMDILRVKIPNKKKLLLVLGSFVAIVLVYYFSRFVWFSSVAILLPFLTMLYFILHHFWDILYFREKFYQEHFMGDPILKYWIVAVVVSFVASLLSYAHYYDSLAGDIGYSTLAISIAVVSFGTLLVSFFNLYKRLTSHRWILPFVAPLVFVGPILFQYITFDDFKFFVIFWHLFLWLLMYPALMQFRKQNGMKRDMVFEHNSWMSDMLGKTRASVGHFVIFATALTAFMFAMYILTALALGISPLDSGMWQGNIFWGYAYLDLWVFMHITFSFFPKEV